MLFLWTSQTLGGKCRTLISTYWA